MTAPPPPDRLQAVADPTRRAILALVAERALPVHAIVGAFHLTQPAISQHLRVLRDAGLVRDRRVGRERHYSADPDGVAALRADVERFWTQRLQQMQADLAQRKGPPDD